MDREHGVLSHERTTHVATHKGHIETMGPLRKTICILLLAATTLAENEGTKKVASPLLQPVVIPGQIGHPVSSQVNETSKVIVEFRISAKNGGRGVRVEDALQVHSESDNAEAEHPLFVVVMANPLAATARCPVLPDGDAHHLSQAGGGVFAADLCIHIEPD